MVQHHRSRLQERHIKMGLNDEIKWNLEILDLELIMYTIVLNPF